MGDLVRAPGDCAEVVTFVETLLPTDTDGIQVRGIEYVRAVEVVDDLPPWAAAMRVRDVAYLPRPPKP